MTVRLAWLSPLPPAPSGIADYSAELLPALAAHADVELFTLPGLPAPADDLARRFPVHPWAELDRRAGGYDALIYQMGNHPRFHGPLWRALERHTGVVMLHEFVLHHMVRELTLVAGDPEGYVEELRYAYGATGRALGRRSVDTGVPLDPWAYPLFERVVDRATGILVHSDFARRRVLASRPAARVASVPLPLGLTGVDRDTDLDSDAGRAADRRSARARLGLPRDAFLVGSFGYQNRAKRLDVALGAFARLRREVPDARLLVVGAVDRQVELPELLASGLGDGVETVGRVETLDDFLTWMRAVDVAVNLRFPTAGETSATVVRLLGLGKPVLVSDVGSFAEIPAGCALPVPVGGAEEELAATYLAALARDDDLRCDLAAAARRFAVEQHAVERCAAGYAAFLRRVADSGRRPEAAPPPLAPWRDDDLYTGLVADLAAEACDLGVDAGDTTLLQDLAGVLVDLDLDGFAPAPEGQR